MNIALPTSSKDKLYFEDLSWEHVQDCGEFQISSDDLVAFGQKYDPQPLHTDPEAARASFFGGLIASGAQVASLAQALVQRGLVQEVHSNGGLEVCEFRLLKPVPADTRMRVTHRFVRACGAVMNGQCEVVEGLTEGFDADGVSTFAIRHLHRIARRGLVSDPVFHPAHKKHHASPVQPRPPSAGSRGTCLEDCPVGKVFGSGPLPVHQSDIDEYRQRFGDPGSGSYYEWMGFSFATRLFIDAVWRHGHAVAGATVSDLQWGRSVVAGLELLCDVEITQSRALKSRDGMGVVHHEIRCSTVDGDLVCRFDIAILVRTREACLSSEAQ